MGLGNRAIAMVLLGSLVGCSRQNPAFEDTDGDTERPHDGSGGTRGETTQGPADGTAGEGSGGGSSSSGIDTLPDSGPPEGTTTAPDTESESGNPADARIVVFEGPELGGNALSELGEESTFTMAANRCADLQMEAHPMLVCPNGVWGLLADDLNPLGGYPLHAGGDALEGAAVVGVVDPTPLAASYGALLGGELLAPLVGHVVDASGEREYWWGQDETGVPSLHCDGWTVGEGEAQTIRANDSNSSMTWSTQSCGSALPILCICF